MTSQPKAYESEVLPEYELPPFTWDEILVSPILASRLRAFGEETIQDLGILSVLAAEITLTGDVGRRARRLLLEFQHLLERSLILRLWTARLELWSSHEGSASIYGCRISDDEAALSWRIELNCTELEDLWSEPFTPAQFLNQAKISVFTSWPCKTAADFLARRALPFPPDLSTVGDVVSSLTPHEANVITLRFGLEDGRGRTLEQIGSRFNVTRSRIGQIEEKALRKLRHPSRSKKLKALSEQLGSVGEAYATKADTVLSAEVFMATADTAFFNPRGTLALLTEIFGRKSERATLDDFESRIFHALAGALGRLPNKDEVVAPPTELVRSVMADEAVENVLRDWPRFSPYGRLKLFAPTLMASGKLRLNSRLLRLSALVAVLEEASQPLHFSEIAERANRRLPLKIKMTERNVHAWLGRYTDTFVWAGLGKYGLKEWDVGRRVDRDDVEIPDELLPTRRRGIADEIVLLLLEAEKPLPLADVEDHILSRFSVNSYSVQAAIEQDAAGRFIMGTDGRVSLAQWDPAAPTGGGRVKRYRSNRAELTEVTARATTWLEEVRGSLRRGCSGVSDDLLTTWIHVASALELKRELDELLVIQRDRRKGRYARELTSATGIPT